MQLKLTAFKGKKESADIIRLLKRYQVPEFAEVFAEDATVIGRLGEILGVVGELIEERMLGRMQAMFSDKTKIEDEAQGDGSEETMRLCEFSFNFLQELMVNYGNQQKAIVDNQPDKDAGDSDETQKKEQKKAKALEAATARLAALNDLLYACMIESCKRFRSIFKAMSEEMLTADFAGYGEDDLRNLITKLDGLATGKYSLLKAIMMFALTIQLYDVGSTDLDEVAEALRDAVEGLNFYIAASQTVSARRPKLNFTELNESFLGDCVKSRRLVAFALSKVAARLVRGKSEDAAEASVLSKHKILRNGTAERFIPRLSANCKAELEGSFKLTKDENLR